MKIAVIGAGDYGSALGGVLADNGHTPFYYDIKLPETNLDDTIKKSEMVLLVVPSNTLTEVLPNLPKEKPLMVATKGILNPQIFDEFSDWMVISGPGYASDIKAKKPTHLTATDDRIIDLFATDYLDFDLTADKKGVLMCGSLKNVYALLAGYLGLVLGTKEREVFLNEAADEMKALLLANGASPSTVDLNCGVGDLNLTCWEPSRNFKCGFNLRKDSNYQPDYTVEGITALKRIIQGEIKVPENLHLLEELERFSLKWSI